MAIDAEYMIYREQHVRNFVRLNPGMADQIDEAIPGLCDGEKASETLERMKRNEEI